MALKNFNAKTTGSKGREERLKVVHRDVSSIFNGLYSRHDEGFKGTTSSSLCWRLAWCVVSCCCDIPVGNNMSGVWHGTIVDCLCASCLVSSGVFCNMNCTVDQNMTATMIDFEEHAMIVDWVSKVKSAKSWAGETARNFK